MTKILLVEDEDNIRQNVATLLTLNDFYVHSVSSVEGALEELKIFTPDLILCDIIMPGAHGYVLLQTVQKIPALKAVPFIFLTAKSDLEDIRKGMNLGADDYVTKPFKQEELITAINLRLKKAEDFRLKLNPEAHDFRTKLKTLSIAETRVLKLLADNKNSHEIGQTLFISFKTVQNHRSNMVRKLQFKGYNALHSFATKCKALGLLEPTD
jgi:FixJ family two-component response regulator